MKESTFKLPHQYYFGDATPKHKLADDLMIKLEYSGILSESFLQYIYTQLLNMLALIEKGNTDGCKEIYDNVKEFLDRYSLFSSDFKMNIRVIFFNIIKFQLSKLIL
jgi:hypothetical protein